MHIRGFSQCIHVALNTKPDKMLKWRGERQDVYDHEGFFLFIIIILEINIPDIWLVMFVTIDCLEKKCRTK